MSASACRCKEGIEQVIGMLEAGVKATELSRVTVNWLEDVRSDVPSRDCLAWHYNSMILLESLLTAIKPLESVDV